MAKPPRIAHIGIAVQRIAQALRFYRDGLGLAVEGEEVVSGQKVRTAFIPTGEVAIELLETLNGEGPIARFIEKRGEGVHHIALEVENLEETLAQLEQQGIPLIDRQPRPGAAGRRIAFVHPKGTHGVLIELCESKGEGQRTDPSTTQPQCEGERRCK